MAYCCICKKKLHHKVKNRTVCNECYSILSFDHKKEVTKILNNLKEGDYVIDLIRYTRELRIKLNKKFKTPIRNHNAN
jgi:hypothetical protein